MARASDEDAVKNNGKGKIYSNKRRGRPAHMRSPDDTPLRDGVPCFDPSLTADKYPRRHIPEWVPCCAPPVASTHPVPRHEVILCPFVVDIHLPQATATD